MYTEHLRIPVGVGSLHAERVGRGGHPVVLLHGFGTCAFLWRAVAPRLADAGYTTIAIDLLGHGESDRPLDAGYGLAAQAEYIERALTSLRLPAVTVVGQDVGALVGMQLASQRPRRVARLMLLNPPDPDDLPGPEIRTLQRTSARAALSANALFGAQSLLEPMLRAAVADPARMSDLLVARYLAPYVGSDGVGHLLQLASAVELPEPEGPSTVEVRAPVLLIHGAADPWTTTEVVKSFAARLPQTAVSTGTLQGVGRLIAEDAPEPLLRLIRAFIESDGLAADRQAGEAATMGKPAPATSPAAGATAAEGRQRIR
ncbi:MAG: alpha/beta hydrolase [Gemmatimonadota bacterium]